MDVVALEAWSPPETGIQLALGFFDGLHRGHQRIIASAIDRARDRGQRAALFTFRDHPMRVLRPTVAPLVLTTFEEKLEVLARSGLDAVIWREFTEAFSRMDADDFIRDVVIGHMGARGAVAGPNYRYGQGARGDVESLRALGPTLGLEVDIVHGVELDDGLVSSTRIRALVAEGAVDEAARMLGRPYSAKADVVHGDARGRTIGFPTANLSVPPEKLLPADGVYAVRVAVDGALVPGVANLGVRPTFGERQRVLEAHLLDFDGDLYGQRVDLEFHRRVRGERKFDGVPALVAQIQLDVAQARELLGT